MTPRKPLVVDVGMHRGEDAESYLSQGFRVLSIEANPDLVTHTRTRLATHVSDGDLRIVHAAIVEEPGDVVLHLGADTGWSSTDPRRADPRGHTSPVIVPGRTLVEVLGDAVAHYIKIDIEGADAAAVRSAMTLPHLPDFLSWEWDMGALDETTELIEGLRSCGFDRFKLVNQALHSNGNLSGPFGESAPGPWLDAAHLVDRCRRLAREQRLRTMAAERERVAGIPLAPIRPLMRRAYGAQPVRTARRQWARLRHTEMGGWFDIHAARSRT